MPASNACSSRSGDDVKRYVSAEPALWALTGVLVAALVVSGWQPFDRGTWVLEVFPVFVVLPVLWFTRDRFPLTTLLYVLIGVHALILIMGGAYSYARVPLGFTLRDLLHLSRNPYDRIGHFAQGFIPAVAIREILIRGRYVQGRRMLSFLVVCVVLAISASYEFIEWGTALALGQGADDFLGTQGDPWDTQWDMFTALVGGVAALIVMPRVHDRQLAPLAQRQS
jgi:putative membrane protein